MSRVFSTCRSQNFDAMEALVNELLADGYPAAQLCSQMLEAILTEGGGAAAAAGDLSSAQKAQIAVQLALVDKNLVDGADEYLQLANLFAFTMRQCKPAAA